MREVNGPAIANGNFAVKTTCSHGEVVRLFVTPLRCYFGKPAYRVLKAQTVPGPSGIVVQGKKHLARS